MPKLNICVDDLGLTPGVTEALVRLQAAGTFGSASCMVNMEHAASVPSELGASFRSLDIGLHFTLTCGRPLSGPPPTSSIVGPDGTFVPLHVLARRAYLGSLRPEDVVQELRAQCERFADIFGGPPSHLDGHHHVHQFPIIRQAILAFVEDIQDGRFYVRNSRISLRQVAALRRARIKALAIGRTGSVMQRELTARGIRTNVSFTGVIPLGEQTFKSVLAMFEDCLRSLRGMGGLMMTHTATTGHTALSDRYGEGRTVELEVLVSEQFRAMLRRHGYEVSGSV